MQLDKIFSTQFLDATTGLPLDSLTGVTITILEVSETDGTTVAIAINNQPCINGGNGFYRYFFSAMEAEKLYEFFINPNNSNTVISSGWVDKRQNYIDKPMSSIIGGYFANSKNDFNASDRKSIKDMYEKVSIIDSKFNETNSHIDIAKNSIIDTIGSIDIPETDISNITEGIGVLKARFTTLQKWLKEEQKKEMEAKDSENEGKLSELQGKIDEMEDAFEEMQNLSKSEVEEKQKLIDDMEETAQEIMQELEKERNTAKELAKKDIISSLSE